MGRRSLSGGVASKGKDRIEFTFVYEGVRYRPTVQRIPSEANLRRARVQLEGIKERIKSGTFSFAEEFPDYRYMARVPDGSTSQPEADSFAVHTTPRSALAPMRRASSKAAPRADKQIQSLLPINVRRTCNAVFDAFLAGCESRVKKKDLAYVTARDYGKLLRQIWRPAIGEDDFESVRYSDLAAVVDSHPSWGKKTYNNAVSVVRCAFEAGYKNHPEKRHLNPALGLSTMRITKKDRREIDPFTIHEAERVIAQIHADWDEAIGNYDEMRFFTGLRPSEEIALTVQDYDPVMGTLQINKARVGRRDKDRTKTGVDRIVELCPRAIQVLNRHLVLRTEYVGAGKIDHDLLFFFPDGKRISDPEVTRWRWSESLQRARVRQRGPYTRAIPM